jgi:hypothetical protein
MIKKITKKISLLQNLEKEFPELENNLILKQENYIFDFTNKKVQLSFTMN